MPRLTHKLLLVSTTVALLAAAQYGPGRLEGHGAARRFISEKYGFSIGFPLGWRVSLANDTPIYVSFNPAESEKFNHQLTLPRGGAVISIMPQEERPGRRYGALSEWAARDARGLTEETPPILPFQMPPETGVATAVISAFDTATFSADDQSEHQVSVFWDFRRQRFGAFLMYPAHDPKGPGFEKVFMETIRSIRPLEQPKAR
jgi:hypothetical protein